MKIILLVRHAKSEWANPSLPDFERRLTSSGESDAKMIANRLRQKVAQIDLFISSPAKRAKQTAKIFMKEFETDEKKLNEWPSLYEPSVNDFYEAIENANDEANSIAIFSHNPGITQFINSLDCAPVYDMPTCAVYAFKIKSTHWKELQVAEKEFLFFDFPKIS